MFPSLAYNDNFFSFSHHIKSLQFSPSGDSILLAAGNSQVFIYAQILIQCNLLGKYLD